MLAMTISSPIDFDAVWAQIIREFRGDPDKTIGACWGADRLDLTRVGIEPSRRFMSTELGKRLCSSRPKLCSDG